MVPIPPLTPTPPESAGARIPARTRSELSDETILQSNANLVYVKLRTMIASDTQSIDTILGDIAVAAHSLTGATGAAVAMPQGGAVVCVGRSGETAPELGARLNVDSGISGECLRTGVTMRCDDASRDFHVNAEVCRELGLQSIAAVPLRGQHGRVGVLEAFSTRSYAFTEDKMAVLERLAGLAEAAWARGAVTEVPSEVPPAVRSDEKSVATTEVPDIVEAPPEPPCPVAATIPLTKVREMFARARDAEPITSRKWRYAIMAAVALLVVALLSVYGWKAWYRSSIASNTNQPTASAPAESENAAAGEGPASTPAIVRPSPRTSSRSFSRSSPRSSSRPGESPTPSVAKGGAKISDTWARRQSRSAERGSATGATQSNSASNSEEIPLIAATNADSADLGKVLTSAAALPTLGVPISRGVAGGVLTYKVQPVYPAEARRMHVQGNVVIDATVTAQGQVDEVKLVSGDAMLAAAALDAVRRWRYTPYSLNGKPIPKQTRITVSFIAPQ
jgi:TonB family protein